MVVAVVVALVVVVAIPGEFEFCSFIHVKVSTCRNLLPVDEHSSLLFAFAVQKTSLARAVNSANVVKR
jgi:hypothetical protein